MPDRRHQEQPQAACLILIGVIYFIKVIYVGRIVNRKHFNILPLTYTGIVTKLTVSRRQKNPRCIYSRHRYNKKRTMSFRPFRRRLSLGQWARQPWKAAFWDEVTQRSFSNLIMIALRQNFQTITRTYAPVAKRNLVNFYEIVK